MGTIVSTPTPSGGGASPATRDSDLFPRAFPGKAPLHWLETRDDARGFLASDRSPPLPGRAATVSAPDQHAPTPRTSGTFALLGLSSARTPRTSETIHAAPGGDVKNDSPGDAPRSSSSSAGPESASSSPGDRKDGESFLLAWEADRIQTRDRLHERLY
jgi:hypothetical protein